MMTGEINKYNGAIHDAQSITSSTYILCCPTLRRELAAAMNDAADTGKEEPTIVYLPAGLHSDPQRLRLYVQAQIDALTDATDIIVCPSGCGGGTIGLQARQGRLILPRTRDCLDILLSTDSLKTLQRPKHGIFLTADWADYMKQSSLDVDRLTKAKGKDEAADFLRRIYAGFTEFYIIDTGTYDTAEVERYITPLVTIVSGTIHYVPGHYGILKKIARQQFDDDFLIVPPGASVPESYYTVDTDL